MRPRRYLVCGVGPWSRAAFNRLTANIHDGDARARGRGDAPTAGRWRFAATRRELTAAVRDWHPDQVFFVHWRWRIPARVWQGRPCVGFHMTDLPYGRGGSPLQNLILRGKTRTRLCAFRVGAGMDDGPVYLRRGLGLAGSADTIYTKAAAAAVDMAFEIAMTGPVPQAQRGLPVVFRRRKAEASALPLAGVTTGDLYDLIRMVDADGYPPAYIDVGQLRLEFCCAVKPRRGSRTLRAVVTIRRRP